MLAPEVLFFVNILSQPDDAESDPAASGLLRALRARRLVRVIRFARIVRFRKAMTLMKKRSCYKSLRMAFQGGLVASQKSQKIFGGFLFAWGRKRGKKETSYIILPRKGFVKETPARLDFCLFVAHCNAVVVPRDLHSLFGIVVVCSWRCGTGLGPSRRFLGKYQGPLSLFFVANFIVLFSMYVFHFPSQTNTK